MSDEIDAETLRIMTSYCGADPRQPWQVTVSVLCEYSGDWTLAEFQDMIANAVTEIPLEYREKASVELEGGYEESTRLNIFYNRPSNAAEIAERVANALAYANNARAEERAQYARLQAKYGR